jgi:hypothetical protein
MPNNRIHFLPSGGLPQKTIGRFLPLVTVWLVLLSSCRISIAEELRFYDLAANKEIALSEPFKVLLPRVPGAMEKGLISFSDADYLMLGLSQ